MGGVAHQKNPTLRKLFRHQRVASGPVLGGQNFHVHLEAQHLSHQLTRCRMIQGLAIFSLVQGRMKGKLLLAIHGHQETATLGIESHVHPSPIMGNLAVHLRRAHIHRMHHPPHEVTLDATGPFIGNAQSGAHRTARPIRTDHELRAHMHRLATIDWAHPRVDVVGTGFKAL